MYEDDQEVGVAHFLEHIVFDGTKKYPTERALAQLVDEKGGFRNGLTNKETVEYVVKVLKEDLDSALEYLSQIVVYPLITDESLVKEKRIVEQEINRFKSDPEKLAHRLIYSALFPGTRLGGFNTGDVEDVKRIKREDILNYLRRTHCAANAILVVCGDVSEEKLKRLVEKYFSEMYAGEKLLPISVDVKPSEDAIINNQPNAKQAFLTLGFQGFPVGSRYRYAADLIAKVMHSGKTARLTYEIREKRAMAYIVNGSNNSRRNSGEYLIRVGLSNDQIPLCLGVIRDELNKITNELIDKDETSKALAFIKANATFAFENSLSEASYYSEKWCLTGGIESMEKELEKYKEIADDPEFIRETARKLFSSKPAILVIGSGITSVGW
jgi:predicted Zn-dependent peptidase